MFRRMHWLILPLILLVVLGFGTYRLSESPAVWGDEGMLMELSINLVRHGEMKSQVAPGAFVSGAFMTTGFPVLYPVGGSFALFGIGLLQARGVMVVYMVLCVAAAYLFARRVVGTRNAALAALLIATFPPFYATGKNVLGEVPGMFFLFAFLLCIHLLETTPRRTRLLMVLAGLSAGLCLVTKPIFLLLFPAMVGGVILLRGRAQIPRDLPACAGFLAGFALPMVIWLITQFFPGDNVHDILSHYANPYQLENVSAVILPNFLRFFREATPLHLLAIFAVWSIAFFIRLFKKQHITFAETIGYAFSGLILLAYLRTPGWYRYFFPAQILALTFLPSSLEYLWGKIGRLKYVPMALAAALIFFHAYQTAFSSWVASTYNGTMTRELQEYFKNADPAKSIYVVPEIIVFLPHNNYYHYIYVVGFKFGEKEAVGALEQGIPDVLVTYRPTWEAPGNPFPRYKEVTRIGRYVIAERR